MTDCCSREHFRVCHHVARRLLPKRSIENGARPRARTKQNPPLAPLHCEDDSTERQRSARPTQLTDVLAGAERSIRPEDNDVLIERQRMELFQPQSLTDQYLNDLDDLDDRYCTPPPAAPLPPCTHLAVAPSTGVTSKLGQIMPDAAWGQSVPP